MILPLPLAIPSYVFAFVLLSIFGGDLLFGFWGAFVSLVLITFPYVFLQTYASLMAVDSKLVDAARMLGKGWGEIFWSVRFPLIRSALVSSSLLVVMSALRLKMA